MDLMVTVTERGAATVIHVDGRLTSRSLGELEQLVRTVNGPIVMDLSNLLSADDAGVVVLRSLAGQGARLEGVSPYVALLLEEGAPAAGHAVDAPPVKAIRGAASRGDERRATGQAPRAPRQRR